MKTFVLLLLALVTMKPVKASSGIEVDSDLKESFNKMKLGKSKMQLLVIALSDDKKKIIKKDDLCKDTCSHEDLVKFFENRLKECLFAVFDDKKKLIVIKWAPDNAPVVMKKAYGEVFKKLKQKLHGVAPLEATGLDDLSKEAMEKAKN